METPLEIPKNYKLQVFRIPQVGYSATTPDLSDKEQFGYFLRVVPSDVFQAQAINRLLHHYNWTYVAVLYSAGKSPDCLAYTFELKLHCHLEKNLQNRIYKKFDALEHREFLKFLKYF